MAREPSQLVQGPTVIWCLARMDIRWSGQGSAVIGGTVGKGRTSFIYKYAEELLIFTPRKLLLTPEISSHRDSFDNSLIESNYTK